ncbi:MAG TPA: alpha/beta hydrolase [Acidimicrobiales bacterium]|nr:alpha/beta hydrolase [Acidimicrobiales bacterium]
MAQQQQRAVELSAGTIEYEDTGGKGSAIVLLHGLAMNNSLWRHVIDDLRSDYRCIAPTFPLGGHRRPMRPDADLSMTGQVHLIAEFLERLGLDDVTLVGNDWGGALLLVSQASEGQAERVGRLVLSSCEAFDNYPPGLPGRTVALAGKLPGGLNALVQPMRLRPLRRLPNAFGRMSKRPIPNEITDGWLRPAMTQRAIRRDIRKYVRSLRKDEFVRAAPKLADFDRPVLIMWAAEDRVMPIEHGRRLAELFPRSQYVEIADSYTLIPEDQPAEFAAHLRAFVKQQTPQSPSSAPA